MLNHIILFMGVGRILLGLAPFLASNLSSRVMSFPKEHDNPTTRLMARFFGVRDVGLGILVFYGLAHSAVLSFVVIFNALTDVGDLVAISIPLVRRHGIDRAALKSAGFALPAAFAWFGVFSLLR